MPSRDKKAVALKYEPDSDAAPVVVAAGYGEIASRIIDVGEQRGIPVFRDDSTASLLCMLEVGRNVPVELYEVVAAIYIELMTISQKIKGGTVPIETLINLDERSQEDDKPV